MPGWTGHLTAIPPYEETTMYQIIEFDAETGKWAFIAHGARYSREDATEWAKRADARDAKYKLLAVPKR